MKKRAMRRASTKKATRRTTKKAAPRRKRRAPVLSKALIEQITAAVVIAVTKTQEAKPRQKPAAPRARRIPVAEKAPVRKPDKTSPAKLTHSEMRKRAIAAILGPMLADVKAGKMDPEDLEFWEDRRGEQIQEHIEAQRRGAKPPPPCSQCDEPSTTVMAGEPYCTRHAREHRQEV